MEHALHIVEFVCEYVHETQIIYILLVLDTKQHWILFLFVVVAIDLKQKILSANSTHRR